MSSCCGEVSALYVTSGISLAFLLCGPRLGRGIRASKRRPLPSSRPGLEASQCWLLPGAVFPSKPPAHTLPPPWPAQALWRKLSSSTETVLNTHFSPCAALPGEIDKIQSLIPPFLLVLPGSYASLFQKSVSLIRGGFYDRIPRPPSLATPRGDGGPFVRRTGFQWRQGC